MSKDKNLTYYQKNKEAKLNKAKGYYKNNKERIREQARGKFRNLFEEEKYIKREYGKNRYYMSEEKKTKTKRISKELLQYKN